MSGNCDYAAVHWMCRETLFRQTLLSFNLRLNEDVNLSLSDIRWFSVCIVNYRSKCDDFEFSPYGASYGWSIEFNVNIIGTSFYLLGCFFFGCVFLNYWSMGDLTITCFWMIVKAHGTQCDKTKKISFHFERSRQHLSQNFKSTYLAER